MGYIVDVRPTLDAVTLTDSFTRADSAISAGSATRTVNGVSASSVAYSAASGTWGITSNQLYVVAQGATSQTVLLIDPGRGNGNFEEFSFKATIPSGGNVGIVFGAIDHQTHFAFRVSETSQNVLPYRIVNGTVTSYTTQSVTITAGQTYKLKVSRKDRDVFFYLYDNADVLLLTYFYQLTPADTEYISLAYSKVGFRVANPSTISGLTFDDMTFIGRSSQVVRTAASRIMVRNFGTSLKFPGVVGDKVQVKSSPILAGNSRFTITTWVKVMGTPPTNGAPLYVERKSTGNDLIKLVVFSSRKLRFSYRDDAGTLNANTANTALTLGQWYHCALVKNLTAITFYVNGVADGTGTLSATDTLTDNALLCMIGNDAVDIGGSNSLAKMVSDEPRLWTTNLTAAEIWNDYYSGKRRTGSVGNWKFDEGSGTAVIDNTGTQANGAITGSITYSTDVVSAVRTTI